MGINCEEDPFNMCMFYNLRCHSKWVCFRIPNTHIRAFLYWSRPPPLGWGQLWGAGGGADRAVWRDTGPDRGRAVSVLWLGEHVLTTSCRIDEQLRCIVPIATLRVASQSKWQGPRRCHIDTALAQFEAGKDSFKSLPVSVGSKAQFIDSWFQSSH